MDNAPSDEGMPGCAGRRGRSCAQHMRSGWPVWLHAQMAELARRGVLARDQPRTTAHTRAHLLPICCPSVRAHMRSSFWRAFTGSGGPAPVVQCRLIAAARTHRASSPPHLLFACSGCPLLLSAGCRQSARARQGSITKRAQAHRQPRLQLITSGAQFRPGGAAAGNGVFRHR